MTFHDFISRFPKATKTGSGDHMVRCPAHEDGKASLSVKESPEGNILLKCFANCTPESITAALGLAMKDLFKDEPKKLFTPKYKTPATPDIPTEKPTIEKIYSYTDALGRELYQAIRLKPKSFRQRHAVSGKWIWSMEGVERVLYRLPEVLKSSKVWIVEGEKDADSLVEKGFCATTNVGGAGKWLDGYTEALAGKDVVICGDNDKKNEKGVSPGEEHVRLVFESIAERAKSVKIVKLSSQFKDVSDFIAANNGNSRKELEELETNAVPHFKGVRLPLYSMADIEPKYKFLVRNTATTQLVFEWLPTLCRNIRPLIPGEMALFVADTKVGKSALLQTIALKSPHLKTLFFQMELPEELMYERFLAMRTRLKCTEVEIAYKTTDDEHGVDALNKLFPNFLICPEPRLTPERLESIITSSELKIGEKPKLVLIDYVQLMHGSGGTRYEKASHIGESLKEIAKATKTIIVLCSQVSRPEKNTDKIFEPSLHSAKDSGSFENSSGLVIGVWRDPSDPTAMHMRVLAATKGGAGTKLVCNFDAERMVITERSRQPEPEQ